jgi:hypothetical protein
MKRRYFLTLVAKMVMGNNFENENFKNDNFENDNFDWMRNANIGSKVCGKE